jgi:hypothetical protein
VVGRVFHSCDVAPLAWQKLKSTRTRCRPDAAENPAGGEGAGASSRRLGAAPAWPSARGGGLRLSAGERQRLALARVALRQAPFLLLDEPTANVDAITERDIMAEVRRLSVERGTLLITHRVVGLEFADEILVLDRGRLVERGSFHALAGTGGRFSRMLDLQRAAAVIEGLPVAVRDT